MTWLNALLRLTIVILLLLNGGYYLWQHFFYQTVKPNSAVFNAPNIYLLSEVTESLIEINPQTAPKEFNCWFLGKFDQQIYALNLEQRLLSFDIATKLVHKIGDNLSMDYLVYLPPNPSMQMALQQINELQTHQLEGYIITSGDLTYAVALGLFPDRSLADQKLSQLRSAGYTPRLREQIRSSDSFWLQIAQQSTDLLDSNVLNKLYQDFPNLTPTIMPCE